MKEQNMPGIGKKYSLISSEGIEIFLILHYSGKREFYISQEKENLEYNFSLTAKEAMEIALKMMDVNNDIVEQEEFERFSLLRKQMLVDWIKVHAGSSLLGLRVSDAEKRVPKGVSIVGIGRDNDIIAKPDSEALIKENDILLVIGESGSISSFQAACRVDQ